VRITEKVLSGLRMHRQFPKTAEESITSNFTFEAAGDSWAG
jgi:hypothetical protein